MTLVKSSNQAASTGTGKGLVHSKHRVRTKAALTVPTRASDPGGRPEHYLQGHRSDALTALADRGSSTWHPPFNERPVVGTTFDDGVQHDTRHLGGNSGHCLAAQIGIVAIPRDVAFELMTERFSRWRMATCPAIHRMRRSRALPNLERRVWPRYWPDCCVERSSPQNFRNWR